MEPGMLNMNGLSRKGLLYPMLVIAAVAVIIFSVLGIATMTGLLPRAESMYEKYAQSPAAETKDTNAATAAGVSSNSARGADAACANCGVVESITPVEVKGNGSGLGMIAGGLTGALLGNQIGRGNGNTVTTIAGAAGGAFAGNEIEKHVKKTVRYQVRVRMNDGTFRTGYQSSAPAFAVGDKVRVVNGQVVARG